MDAFNHFKHFDFQMAMVILEMRMCNTSTVEANRRQRPVQTLKF